MSELSGTRADRADADAGATTARRRSDPPSDLTGLLQRVTAGDRQAFERLYSATNRKLYAIALRILRRRDLAEEAVQDAYLRIWLQSARFDPARGSEFMWMARIARNRALDLARYGKGISSADAPDHFDEPDCRPDPAEQAELNDDLRRLSACLNALGENQRQAFLLAYWDGWSRGDLSIHFNKPVPTIKTWLRRSLLKIRMEFE